ncbi:MAG: sigma 54-interacting transcriptional regulator [Nannocystaceae bacterium]
MSDAKGENLRLVREAMASLQRLDASSPEAARGWAQQHFAALVALERALLRPAAAAPADAGLAEAHAALVRTLGAFFVDPGADPIGAALEGLMTLAGAQRGFVAIRRADGALDFPSARTLSEVELGDPEAEVSRTILEAAIRGDGRPLQVDDASADARFAATPSVQRLAIRAVLVIPLVDAGRAFGVVYLDSPGASAGFDPRRRQAAEAFAAAAAGRVRAATGPEGAAASASTGGSRVEHLRRAHDLSGLCGEAPALAVALERALAVAPTDAPTLIAGETGVGKSLLARIIHRNSRRAAGPRVELRCADAGPDRLAALRDARARARGGTLILDGIDALSPPEQIALAAALEAARADADAARILAIRGDPRAVDADAALRPELRYRVGVVELEVPPLRERRQDLEALAAHLLAESAARRGGATPRLRPDALACLEGHGWPGNVRELQNALEAASLAAAGGSIGPEHLPEPLRGRAVDPAAAGAGLKEAVRAFRRRFVERVMAESGDDHRQAAATLGVHPKYLYKLLRELREDE